MQPSIKSLREAINYFLSRIGGTVVRDITGARGVIGKVIAVRVGIGEYGIPIIKKFYVFFKKDWFRSFGQIYGGREGWGQSVHLGALNAAALEGAFIAIVMPDGRIYSLAASEWLEYAKQHNTIRAPSTEESLEASVPARLLKRLV